jgi:hypothetical protein
VEWGSWEVNKHTRVDQVKTRRPASVAIPSVTRGYTAAAV